MSEYFVHESSYVDQGAEIGAGTKIWHFCHVMSGARIGRGCSLGQNVFVAAQVCIGDRVKIQNNVSVYTGVTIEDEAFLGPSMVFTNVINPRSGVERKDEYRSTRVGKGATIGANATIVCGVRLGAYCFVGAGAVVTRDIPDYGLATGNPARVRGWMCKCGEKLPMETTAGRQAATCARCGSSYRKEGETVIELNGDAGNQDFG